MAAGKTIKTSIQINADIKSFEQGLSSIETKLAQLKMPAGLSRAFAQEISTIKDQLSKLSDYTANNELSIVDAKKAQKSLDIIQQQYSKLIATLKDERMGEVVSKDDAKRLEALVGAMETYNTKMAAAVKQEEQLIKQVNRATAAQEAFNKKKEQQKVIDDASYDVMKKQLADRQKEEKKLVDAAAAAAAAKEKRKADSGGKYTSDDSVGFKQTKEYKEWKAIIDQLNKSKEITLQLERQLAGVTTASVQAQEEKKVTDAVTDANAALETFRNTALQTAKTEAMSAVREELKDVEGLTPETVQSIDDLKQIIEDQAQAAANNGAALRQMDGELETCGQAAKDMGEKVETSTEDLNKQNQAANNVKGFVERIKQFTGLAGAMMIIRKVAQGAFNAIKELDAQMTEMAVVTSQGVGDYWKQMPEHTKRANELGVAIKDVYEAETLYYQQGLKANEVTEMSNSTLRMARIAGLGAAEATDKITAALRGFNMELNGASADRVADVYSKLAAITASNVDEISTAMTKTASIASNAGMQFETTAAFLSQIIETTRESAETAGTALKTVIARFQELKKDPSEIGEVDGEVVDANKIETALRSVGVELRDVSGQFRDLDTVFMELAGKWDSLDTNTQRYIATIAAGSRQQSRFIAMMSDYSRTTELVDAANNAAGASNEQFEKTLDSLETCLNRLNNAWTEFTTGLMNSEFVKFIVDALTGILNALNSLTSSSDSTVNSMLKLGLIVGIVFAAKAAVEAFTASYETSGSVIGGVSGVVTGFITGVKNTVVGLAQTLAGTFDKTYGLKIQSQQVEIAKKKTQELTKTNERLAQIERELDKIDQAKNSKKGASNAQLNRENLLLQEQNKLKTRQGVLESELAGSKTLLAVAEAKEFAAKVAAVSAEEADAVAKAAGIPIDNAKILLAKGYTAEQIKEMGAKNANTLATKIKNATENAATATGLRLWLATKLQTIADKQSAKAKGKSRIATLAQAAANWVLNTSLGVILLVVLAIIAAIVILVALIYLIVKAIKKAKANTPEERLKRDKKALEEMNEAANKAAESYQNLSESINKIKDGYKNLDTLTVGTKEWKDAVEDVNSQVMDLIDKYPELASQVENVNGVMKLSDEALDSIAQREKAIADTKKIDAINQSVKVANTAAEVEEKQTKQELTSQLVKRGILTYNNGGMGEAANNQKKVNEATDQAKVVAEALASRKLSGKATASQIKEYLASQNITISDDMAKSFEESRDQLKEWGESLKQVTNANLIAAQKLSKIALDQTNLSEEQKANMSDAATEISLQMQEQNEKYAKSIGEGYDGLSKDQKKERTKDMYEHYGNGDAETGKEKYLQWARETFGQEVRVDEFGNVLDGKGEKIGSNVDTMQRFAKAQSVADTARIAEKYQTHLDKMGAQSEQANSAVKKFGNKKSMTGADLAALSAGDAQAELDKLNQKEDLTEDELILQTYYKELVAAQDMRNKNLEAFQDKLKENYHIDSNTLKQMTDMATNVSSEMLTGFTNALANNNIKDSAAVQNLWDQFAQVINTDGLSSEQREDIARQFNSLDMTDKYAIEAFKEEMEKTYKGMGIDWTKLTDSMVTAGRALHKISSEELPTFATNMNKIISELKSGAKQANFTQEEWEQMSKSLDANLKKQFVRMNDGTYQFIGGINQLANALQKNTKNLIKEQYAVIDQELQDAKDATRVKTSNVDQAMLDNVSGKIDPRAGYLYNDLKARLSNLDVDDAEAVKAFKDQMNKLYGSSLKNVNLDKLIKDSYKITIDKDKQEEYENKYKESLEKRQEVATTYGQSLSPTELNRMITDTMNKTERFSSKQKKEEAEAELEGYKNAKLALAANAGVDQSLITKYQEAQEKAEKKKEEYDSISYLRIFSKISANSEYKKAQKAEEAALEALDNAIFQATSSFSNVNIATDNLKRSQDALAITQKKYQAILGDSSKNALDLVENLNKQKEQLNSIITNSQTVIDAQEESIKAQKQAIMSQYEETYGKNLIVFDEESQSYKINEKMGRKAWNEGDEEALVKALEELNKKQEDKLKAQEEQDQAKADLKAQEESSQKAMASALDKIVPILEKNKQDQIDSLTTLNEVITEVQSSILDGMRESIELERQIRDNTQKEQDIQDKETRLAYLMADSSGANANEIASLQKEISSARQDQTDTLIDQALDKIENDNTKAAEQRQQQIDLMKEQLELDKQGELRAQAFELLRNGTLDSLETFKSSDFADKVKQTEEYKNLSEIEKESYLDELYKTLTEGLAGMLNLGVTHYATGGLVESTGPAWLDGTPSNPELVLNSQDARNFLMLKDVLSELVGAHTSNYNETDNKNSNTSYVDIDINVDSLSSDYDVDNIANRIQEYLAENALYRNTTMVSNRR